MEPFTYLPLKHKAPIIPIAMLGGAVQAGFPSPALDYMEDEISLDETLIKNKLATFLMAVAGDSMIEAHIPPGAWIVVDRSLTPNNMDIIVAILDADLTVKHYKKEGNQCWLLPANRKYAPIEISEEMRFEVWGVVIHVIHSLKPTSYVRFNGLQ